MFINFSREWWKWCHQKFSIHWLVMKTSKLKITLKKLLYAYINKLLICSAKIFEINNCTEFIWDERQWMSYMAEAFCSLISQNDRQLCFTYFLTFWRRFQVILLIWLFLLQGDQGLHNSLRYIIRLFLKKILSFLNIYWWLAFMSVYAPCAFWSKPEENIRLHRTGVTYGC